MLEWELNLTTLKALNFIIMLIVCRVLNHISTILVQVPKNQMPRTPLELEGCMCQTIHFYSYIWVLVFY